MPSSAFILPFKLHFAKMSPFLHRLRLLKKYCCDLAAIAVILFISRSRRSSNSNQVFVFQSNSLLANESRAEIVRRSHFPHAEQHYSKSFPISCFQERIISQSLLLIREARNGRAKVSGQGGTIDFFWAKSVNIRDETASLRSLARSRLRRPQHIDVTERANNCVGQTEHVYWTSSTHLHIMGEGMLFGRLHSLYLLDDCEWKTLKAPHYQAKEEQAAPSVSAGDQQRMIIAGCPVSADL